MSLVKWARWGWGGFKEGGLFRPDSAPPRGAAPVSRPVAAVSVPVAGAEVPSAPEAEVGPSSAASETPSAETAEQPPAGDDEADENKS